MKKTVLLVAWLFIIIGESRPQSIGGWVRQSPNPQDTVTHHAGGILPAERQSLNWEASRRTPPAISRITLGNPTLIGRWAWGPCYALADRGKNYVLVGNGSLLQVYDVGGPLPPKVVAERLVGRVYDIQSRDSLAFLCLGSNLEAWSVARPLDPLQLGSVALPGGAERVLVTDSICFVLGFGGDLAAVDYRDPRNLRLRGRASAGGMNLGHGLFETRAGYVYVSDPDIIGGGSIVNATNPDSMVRNTFNAPEITDCGGMLDTLLLVGGEALLIYSVADPTVPPNGIESLDGFHYARDIATRDSLAYVSDVRGLHAVNLRDPSHPFVQGSSVPNWGVGAGKTILVGPRAYIAAGTHFASIDISRQDSFSVLARVPSGDFSSRIALQDSLAFVASGFAGTWVVSVADSTAPRSVANIATGGNCIDVKVHGRYLYSLSMAVTGNDTAGGLYVSDVSTPSAPRLLTHFSGIVRYSGHGTNRFSVRDTLLALTQPWSTASDTTLTLYSISNPTSPQPLSTIRGRYDIFDVALVDSLLLVASPDSGLWIYSVKDPHHPEELSHTTMVLSGAFAVKDSLLYCLENGIKVVSLKNPRAPELVGSGGTSHNISWPTMAVSGNYVYWVDQAGHALDISNPSKPTETFSFRGTDAGSGIATRGNLIYYGDGVGGMWIWRNDLLASVGGSSSRRTFDARDFELRTNYPNPFNGQTTISFRTGRQGWVELKVFNALGQEIATLCDTELAAGEHRLTYQANGLASGVFFLRLKSGQNFQTRMMTYVR